VAGLSAAGGACREGPKVDDMAERRWPGLMAARVLQTGPEQVLGDAADRKRSSQWDTAGDSSPGVHRDRAKTTMMEFWQRAVCGRRNTSHGVRGVCGGIPQHVCFSFSSNRGLAAALRSQGARLSGLRSGDSSRDLARDSFPSEQFDSSKRCRRSRHTSAQPVRV
jgi:hypothetical protein